MAFSLCNQTNQSNTFFLCNQFCQIPFLRSNIGVSIRSAHYWGSAHYWRVTLLSRELFETAISEKQKRIVDKRSTLQKFESKAYKPTAQHLLKEINNIVRVTTNRRKCSPHDS